MAYFELKEQITVEPGDTIELDRYMISKIKDIKDALYKWGDEHKDTVRMIWVGLDPYDKEYIRVVYSIPTSDIWDENLPTREMKYVKTPAGLGIPVYRVVNSSISLIEKVLKERGLIDKYKEIYDRAQEIIGPYYIDTDSVKVIYNGPTTVYNKTIKEIYDRAQEIIEQTPYKYLKSAIRIPNGRSKYGLRAEYTCIDEFAGVVKPEREIERGRLIGMPVDADETVKDIFSSMAVLWRERMWPNGDVISVSKNNYCDDTYYFDVYVRYGINSVDWPTNETTVDRKWHDLITVRMSDCKLADSTIRFVVNMQRRIYEWKWPDKNPALAKAALNSIYGVSAFGMQYINKEEEKMNVKYMIKIMIDSNRVGKYSDGSYNKAVLDADLRRLLIHYETERDEYINHYKMCEPTKIIYNGPATIVFFKDGDKVVVKKQDGDMMDREKAVAMAVMKKVLGTNEKKTNYLDKVKKLVKEAEKEERKQQVAKSKELIDRARAELSGRMEFTKSQAAAWLAWYDTCRKKHVGAGCEKAIATEMGYDTITKFRKAKKDAQVKAKEEF